MWGQMEKVGRYWLKDKHTSDLPSRVSSLRLHAVNVLKSPTVLSPMQEGENSDRWRWNTIKQDGEIENVR